MTTSNPVTLVVTNADDVHGAAVARRVSMISDDGAECLILDPASIPTRTGIEWRFGEKSHSALALGEPLPLGLKPDGRTTSSSGRTRAIEPRDTLGVWWRRPRPVGRHPEVEDEPELVAAAANAWAAAFRAFVALAPTFNSPEAQARANLKPLQLAVAERCGFAIPRTLITADPAHAGEFVDAVTTDGGQVIYKPVASAPDGPPVRLFRPEDRARLPSLRFAPTQFQRYVPGVSLRVAVVAGQVFATTWERPDEGDWSVDIRFGASAPKRAVALAEHTVSRLRRLQRELRLVLAVYDLIERASGEVVFLEVNPGGQWLDLEVEGGHPVSSAVARCLLGQTRIATGNHEPFELADLEAMADGSAGPVVNAQGSN